MRSLFSHHAYVIEHDVATGIAALLTRLERDENVRVQGNPDMWREEYDVFGIDHARMLHEIQSRKALERGRKIIIVGFQSITSEAQNALLKVFEEPTADTHFFIITPSCATLLPTVRSRVSTLVLDDAHEEKTDHGLAEAFLTASFPQRQKLLAPLIEEKDKRKSIAFINALEAVLYKKHQSGEHAVSAIIFHEVHRTRGYLRDRAPSVKILLEHLALIIPTL